MFTQTLFSIGTILLLYIAMRRIHKHLTLDERKGKESFKKEKKNRIEVTLVII